MSVAAFFLPLCAFSQAPDTLQFYFDTDAHTSFVLRTEDKQRLKSLPEDISILAFLGHSDTRGSDDYNLNLSRKRVQHVRNHLAEIGFDVTKSSNEAMGESEAKNAGLSMADCRRVDMIYVRPKAQTAPPVETVVIVEKPAEVSKGVSKTAVQEFLENKEAKALEFELTILFVNASVRALEESRPEMFRLLEIMQNNPTLNATFHGHVCCSPHQEISEGRARTVAVFLRENGIAADRLNFIGHSNTQPKVWPEVTDEDRKQNRRVTVVFTKS